VPAPATPGAVERRHRPWGASAALAQLNGWTAQIRAALDDAGAHNAEITFGSVQVQPNTQQSGAVTSFTESQTINNQTVGL
jgi:hypothetical protein